MNSLFSIKNYLLSVAVVISLASSLAMASDAHDDHKKEDHAHDDDSHVKEKGEHSEGEGHEDSHESEGSSVVGPDKGILAANEKDGFKLSPEATKNFDIKTVPLSEGTSWVIPAAAISYSALEVNLYRFRNGSYKRIDFKTLSKDITSRRISSTDLKAGESIVTTGLGFLRVAEIAAFGGAPEGHSH